MATEVPRRRSKAGNGNGHNGNGNGNGHNGDGNGNGYHSSLPSGSEQVREVLHVLFKRRRLVAFLFIVVALPGLIITYLRRPSFVATAKVLITTQRADMTLQPTDLTRLTTVNLNESVVNSEVHIIRSRELLEQVVQRLALGSSGGSQATREAAKSLAAQTHLGSQILQLGDSLMVTPIKNSNVIEVDYRASDPKRAALVVNRVIDEYLGYHATVHGTKGLTRFYEGQRQGLEQNVRKAEMRLQEFAAREGIVDPKAEIEANVRSIAETESGLRGARATISGLEEKIRTIQQQIAEQPEVVKRFQYVEINPVVTTLAQQLAERQIDRIGLLRRYTQKDRLVRDNGEEIAALKNELTKERAQHPTVSGRQIMRVNPVLEERTRTLLDLESTLREQRARRVAMEEQLNASSRHLVQLRSKSLEYDRLAQEVQNWRSTYELYVKREEEARVSEAMDNEKMVNVEVVERPALPLPRADRRRSSAVLALLSGLIVSLGGAFGYEYLNRSLKSERDVERYLGLPLLGAVSDSSSKR